MSIWTPIPAISLTPTPWRNGLGTSRTIASGDHWTIGLADLVQDTAFSHYPHTDRIFTPIEGEPPPELSFHGAPFEPCPLRVPRRFAGDIPTLSRIPAPGRAFNVLVDRRYHTADVRLLRTAAGEPIDVPGDDTVLLFCLSGELRPIDVNQDPNSSIRPGDSLIRTRPDHPARWTAIESGVFLKASIRPIERQPTS